MEKRPSGILLVDKPENMSSARVVAIIKRLLGAKKVGHAGTLDPFATGLLVCCLNQATKLARFFLKGKKTYEAVLCLGVETDTQDATGVVVSTFDEVNVSEKTIHSTMKEFEGPVDQHPPVYSALKHKGVPLYKLARSGQPVQKPARRIFIYSIDRVSVRLPEIRFTVLCSSGTYIRTLCADIGKKMGCGAHLKALKRTQSSGFEIEQAMTLTEIVRHAVSGTLSDRLINMANALTDMPEHIADDAQASQIRNGAIITESDISSGRFVKPDGYVKIVGVDKELIAVLHRPDQDDRFQYCCVFNR
ncbi:tRNA pseudouridine(55) synthase TruB [Thermodesulfobacteriota bacterium]